MNLKGLLAAVRQHPRYKEISDGTKAAGKESLEIAIYRYARPCMIGSLWDEQNRPLIVVVPRPADARMMSELLFNYLGNDAPVFLIPEPDGLPYERITPDTYSNNQRLHALAALQEFRMGFRTRAPIMVMATSSLLTRTISPNLFSSVTLKISVGENCILTELSEKLAILGYRNQGSVEVPGSFSRRGGIIDIYPPSSSLPVRVELFGNEIESIRLFDPESQISVDQIENIAIIPCTEMLPSFINQDTLSTMVNNLNFDRCLSSNRRRIEGEIEKVFYDQLSIEGLSFYSGFFNHGSILEFMPENTLVILDRLGEIENEAESIEKTRDNIRISKESRGELPSNFPVPQLSWKAVCSDIKKMQQLSMGGWTGIDDGLGFGSAPSYFGKTHEFVAGIKCLLAENSRVVIVSRNSGRIAEVFKDNGISPQMFSESGEVPKPGVLTLVNGSLDGGWAFSVSTFKAVIFSDQELFGVSKKRTRRKRHSTKEHISLPELRLGEYVVHVDHGIARFAGTKPIEHNGEVREYLLFEYAGSDKLYVPTDQLDRVTPYLTPSNKPPVLTRLGTSEWSRLKERTRDSAKQMADELLKLYASRQLALGHSFAPDSPWQHELEDSFPFEETGDQIRTIDEIKHDMEESRPMDRLVCGDVGYGKTEVAVRSAFKAITDGKQVAILVPTTVLAQQHYTTFVERLSPFPVRVEVLSRFRTKKEQNEVLEALQYGTVDIVIGTHRLLQKDIKFKDLGMVIIDEEQRFGVSDKEKLKTIRTEVDFLTLGATPIPRTLYMGLLGIRDMSTMDTPPEERLAVRTYVCEYNDDIIKEAILRELERGGQVFFLHNRVRSIDRIADNLRCLVPQARIGIGHGQMQESELEEIMLDFSNGQLDVLVCTTIIESGLDIPNANTLIIDRADRFGLAQLYQLRGRVGRGGNRAYAYLIVPDSKRISEPAEQRLKTILEASEIGSGFRIAIRDLEIRGAGNILGSEQSGYIHAVGYELYTKLLKESVTELEGLNKVKKPQLAENNSIRTRITLPFPAHIPETYVPYLPSRLSLYRRLINVDTVQAINSIREELFDRFGELPSAVENLLYVTNLKLFATEAGIEAIFQSKSEVVFTLCKPLDGEKTIFMKSLVSDVRTGNRNLYMSPCDDVIQLKSRILDVVKALKNWVGSGSHGASYTSNHGSG